MRLGGALVVVLVGAILGSRFPVAALVAVVLCVTTAVVLAWVSFQNPSVASLRHAALGAGGMALLAVIVGLLILAAPRLSVDARQWLRGTMLVIVSLPAVYWLILLATGGFDDT